MHWYDSSSTCLHGWVEHLGRLSATFYVRACDAHEVVCECSLSLGCSASRVNGDLHCNQDQGTCPRQRVGTHADLRVVGGSSG